ncbi:MAG: FAD-dependent oxidoreductase [Thermoplasmata archaeon]|jgi:NADH dehydrogenase|nr:FAD-dependent oxidoreductase [Thermoplasmata archaeon]
MATPVNDSGAGPVVILGAGYAGLTVAREVARRARGRLPLVLVDRNPVHVLRTELYEIGKIAAAAGDPRPWTVPLAKVLDRTGTTLRQGSVESIDLDRRTVRLDSGEEIRYGFLVIALGSVAAYYGVPGAAENTYNVYRLSGAQRLAAVVRDTERASAGLPGERRPRFVIVGGGSTGTELAAELATTDWEQISGPGARPPDVILVTGALPFLAGFPPKLIVHARELLRRAGVSLVHGVNVSHVDPGKVTLEDGSVLACDAAVWCAGLEAPAVAKTLAVPHGKGGRIAVEPTLALPNHPTVFALGDVAEIRDPSTGLLVPATAQAALAEARTAGRNIVARFEGRVLEPFRFRERGVVVALGLGTAAGTLGRATIWGSPAALLKRLVEREYSRAAEKGQESRLL